MEDLKLLRRTSSRWADVPPELLVTIFSKMSRWLEVSLVCVNWRQA
uniref:Uncharacterized protein n=1 Tax=Arundo donax TaxID=35708 RepID=A0A0A8Z552_ARUDO